MGDAVKLSGRIQPEGRAGKRTITGFRIDARVTRAINADGGDPNETLHIPVSASDIVDGDGNFSLELTGDGDAVEPIKLSVFRPDGLAVASRDVTLAEAGRPVNMKVAGIEPFVIAPIDTPAGGTLAGRVIDEQGGKVPGGLPVVIWGVDDGAAAGAEPRPLVVTDTKPGGYFSADWTSDVLDSAFARVAGSAPAPILLDDNKRLPRRVLLVLDIPETNLENETAPRNPEPIDLVNNPTAFSQDLGECVDLTTPNRTIEEFSYYMVVRTSEPDLQGLTLQDRKTVPPRSIASLVEASGMSEITAGRASGLNSLSQMKTLSLDASTAKHLLRGDSPPTLAQIGKAAWLSEVGHAKDIIGAVVSGRPARVALDADQPIDWDETPTIHQATTLATGHILEFREVWRADGYSLGDLLHSLPLAPGQRRQVAVVDWERRTSTSREEALEFEEELDAFASRDRDISEIVGSRLDQESRAGSSNSTWGVAGGIGAGFIGSGFGIFGGIAGGASGSSSNAWQNNSRTFSGNSLQSLRDRVMQRASSVRDQRSTVVQSVAQGETQRVETETVANYNRSHTMTVEYFEVLRHFLVTHELADVRECMFVPFAMSMFDRGKALRWREPLARHLRNRRLAGGFDAIRRVADNWEGWDYPVSRYSEEAPESVEGELRISFVLPRPRDAADGAFQVDMWKPYSWILPYDPFERWIAGIANKAIRERDVYFRQNIAPEIAERLVDRMRFSYITNDGSEIEVPLDGTLVSRYAEGVPLYVTLRPRGGVPAIPREDIVRFKIDYDGEPLPPDAQVLVHSGKVRYRTPYSTGVLFNEGRILNDIAENDPVIVATPLSRAEMRNPREEDRDLADKLVGHLNESIEYYHQAIWMSLDAQRRFMLLDGVEVPGLDGRSVASVVENRVIGIAGNSLIMPLSPGQGIDPRVNSESEGSLKDLYSTNPPPPTRISVPTRGVYAEAVLGDCNASEEIDDTRYWRWSTEGMLDLPDIEPVDTGSREEEEPDLTPTPLPKPLVSIQNAPELPSPLGLGEVFKLMAKDPFTDITGLEGTQRNARGAFDAAMSTASGLATEAANLARQQEAGKNGERMLDRIGDARSNGLLSPQVAQELSEKVLGTLVGQPKTDGDKSKPPVSDPAVEKVIDKAAQSGKAEIKVTTADETVEMGFDEGDVAIGAGGATGVVDVDQWVDQVLIVDRADAGKPPGARTITPIPIPTLAGLKALSAAHFANIDGKFVRANPADPKKYQFMRRMRIAYPADPKDTKKVGGKGRLPVAVLVHGQHESWQAGEVRNHDGYTYLQDYLASKGIVSVSVDTNAANYYGSLIEMRADMTMNALDAVRKLDNDPASRFFGRLAFDKVGLMGHSRGGDAVVRAAAMNAARPAAARYGIKAVCALAPTDFTGTSVPGQVNKLTAASTGFFAVVYGGLDGDVSGAGGAKTFGGTGFRHYDRADTQKAMVFIPKANHNRFNRTWSTDDFGTKPSDIARLISRTDHEKLANEYIGGLFEWRLLGAKSPGGLFQGFLSTTGHDTSVQWSHGKTVKTVEDFEGAAGTLGTRTVRTATVDDFAAVKVGGTALEPHVQNTTRIIAVDANIPGPAQPALELAIAVGHKDWSHFDLLTFNLSCWFDVTSEAKINAGQYPPQCGIILVDGAGGSATVDERAFTTPSMPGRPIFHEVEYPDGAGGVVTINATSHRLATVQIAMASFGGVDLRDVKTLMVQPGAAFPQHVFIDSIRLIGV